MDLIQKAKNLGCIIKNNEYYLWEIQKWIREVHNLHIYIDTTNNFGDMESHKKKYKASVKVPFNSFKWTTGHYYLGNTYEEALEEGLHKALLLITTT